MSRTPARLGVLLVVILGLIGTLALPVPTWRTGRLPGPELTFEAADALPVPLTRVWIDTDAACGHGSRTDVDDCLALRVLVRIPDIDIAGMSTVFGNAPLHVTDVTTRRLVDVLWPAPDERPAIHRGAARADVDAPGEPTDARLAIQQALERDRLTIVALGPLTNIADALATRPDLHQNVDRIVAVMGSRKGHLFHPSEASGKGSLLGHGPIFRDFNFALDIGAAGDLLAMNLPLTLVPYDAARGVEITEADLDALAQSDPAGAWIAERSRGWLEYWLTDVGRSGFYPFDVLAAAYVRAPQQFRCARVQAWVHHPAVPIPFLRSPGLLVAQEPDGDARAAGVKALYCPEVREGFEERLRDWLGVRPRTRTPSLRSNSCGSSGGETMG